MFGVILEGFWKHFGLQKPFEIRSRFLVAFLGPDTDRRDLDGTSAGVFLRRIPPRAAPFRARRDTKRPQERKHEIQHALGQRPGEFI